MDLLTELPGYVLALLAILLVAQISFMIWALVDLLRRPAARVRGPKWLWAIIIVFGELIGPIIYLVFARLPETIDVVPSAGTPDRVSAAADVLYGPDPGTSDRPNDRAET